MSGARNQPPTEKRLRDARSRGEVAVSRELTSAAAWAAGLAALALCAPRIAAQLAGVLRSTLVTATSERPPDARGALLAAALQLALAASVPLASAAVAALACGALQTRGLWSPAAIAPRWSRVAPGAALRRWCSGAQLTAVALGSAKTFAVLLAAWTARDALVAGAAAVAAATSAASALSGIASPAARLAWRIAPLVLAFGALDLVLARRRHRRALRMTHDEVRREQKEQDGSPEHKAERRRLHRSLAAAMPVSRATCVVVNPTHLSVALQHDGSAEGAPVVIAKGSGAEAARIRAMALRASVPIVRDVPLARALYRLADVGDEIPEELYEAAAAVLVHLHGVAPEHAP